MAFLLEFGGGMSSDLKLKLGPRPLVFPGVKACPQFTGISFQAWEMRPNQITKRCGDVSKS